MKRSVVIIASIIMLAWMHFPVQGNDYEYCQDIYPTHNIVWAEKENLLAVGFASSLYVYDSHLSLLGRTEDQYQDSEISLVLWQPSSSHFFATTVSSEWIIWDTLKNSYERIPVLDDETIGGDWYPQGRYLALILGGSSDVEPGPWYAVRVIDPETYEWISEGIASQRNKIWSIAWRPINDVLAIGEEQGRLSFWNPFTVTPLGAEVLGSGNVQVLQWNSNGTLIAVGLSDGTAGIWNYNKRTWHRLLKPTDEGWVTGLAWHDAPLQLAVALSDGEVKIFDIEHDRVVREMTTTPSNTVSLAWKGSQLAVFSCTGDLQLWDTDSARLIKKIKVGN